MKRSILLFAILLTYSFAMGQRHQHSTDKKVPDSQYNENPNVLFEVRFGPSVNWFAPTSNILKRERVKGGFIAGVGVDVNLIEKRFLYFSTGLSFKYLQGGILFSNQYPFSLMDTSFLLPAKRYYETMYLTIPTGIKFRTPSSKNCVFIGEIGLSHNFKVAGNQYDRFEFPEKEKHAETEYFMTTKIIKNKDAALFAEAGYMGAGFEYILGNRTRVFASIDYNCQFNYFSYSAKNEMHFKSIIHSLYITFGFLF